MEQRIWLLLISNERGVSRGVSACVCLYKYARYVRAAPLTALQRVELGNALEIRNRILSGTARGSVPVAWTENVTVFPGM